MDARKLRSRDRVLVAAAELLVERGPAGATVDGIAARSGVAKTTIYRQWPSRAALLLDVLQSDDDGAPTPDAGGLVEDLRLLARAFAAELSEDRGAAAIHALLWGPAAWGDDPLDDLRRATYGAHQRRTRTVVRRAIERGELPARTDAGEVLRLLQGPLVHRRFVEGKAVSPAIADRVAERVAQSLAH
jgi:AcrR family transcriptional regulator